MEDALQSYALLLFEGVTHLGLQDLLLNYSTRRGYKIEGWELGNEPDAYEHSFGYDITASQRADDYLKLHRLLNEYS
jgi:hypothetical protein